MRRLFHATLLARGDPDRIEIFRTQFHGQIMGWLGLQNKEAWRRPG
jgi:hypothetical protein